MNNLSIKDIISKLDINKGDTVFVSSDIYKLALEFKENSQTFDTNFFIDTVIERIGVTGTLVFPTYNWDFCKGKTFDYNNTKCKTGALGKTALKRTDFKRTKHPIYSFAVWGKDKDLLCSMNNVSSFGIDSPFAYFYENKAKNLILGVDYDNSLTYVHYVEEQVGGLCYRYMKNFTADYIDEKGNISNRTYSMLVRDLSLDVRIKINPIGEILESKGISKKQIINNVEFILLDMYEAYTVIKDDILFNSSKNICSYIGQEMKRNFN